MTIEDQQALASDLQQTLARLESTLQESAAVVAELRRLLPDSQQSEPARGLPAASFGRPVLLAPTPITPTGAPVPVASVPARGEALTTFQLAFESSGNPLDLRAVDEAVNAHPAVRDVALIDYDGHRATLKVWISAAARPSDVQDTLRERASQLFPAGAGVSVLALDGVA
jgi:hypothetical protein